MTISKTKTDFSSTKAKRVCLVCATDISNTRWNRRYCCDACYRKGGEPTRQRWRKEKMKDSIWVAARKERQKARSQLPEVIEARRAYRYLYNRTVLRDSDRKEERKKRNRAYYVKMRVATLAMKIITGEANAD